MKNARDVLIIGVAGGSCSGKTTLARGLHAALGDERSAVIFQDSYYIDQSHRFDGDGGEVNFDHPDSIDFALLAEHLKCLKQGRGVRMPIYDFVTHTRRSETEPMEPRSILIVDGTLILHSEEVRAVLDQKVFVRCSDQVRFERRKDRDTRERGREVEGVIRQWENHVQPMHDRFVEPSSAYAGQVIDGERHFNIESLLQGL